MGYKKSTIVSLLNKRKQAHLDRLAKEESTPSAEVKGWIDFGKSLARDTVRDKIANTVNRQNDLIFDAIDAKVSDEKLAEVCRSAHTAILNSIPKQPSSWRHGSFAEAKASRVNEMKVEVEDQVAQIDGALEFIAADDADVLSSSTLRQLGILQLLKLK